MQVYDTNSLETKKAHSLAYIENLKKVLDIMKIEDIAKVLEVLEYAFLNGKYIWTAGNGGSAATASHMASDFQKTTLGKRPQDKNDIWKMKAIALSDNIPVMTAWGNDEGYEYIFSEQLKVLGNTQDVLVVITGSGNSPNILKVIEQAKKMGIITIGLLGFSGGKAKDMVDYSIIVPADKFGPIEDIHMILDHLITAYFTNNIAKTYE